MDKSFWAILIGVVVLLGGAFVLSGGKADTDTDQFQYQGDALSIQEFDYTSGNNDQLTVIEYGDFECPACRNVFPDVNQLKEEYGDRLTFVFRHFPLTSIHQNALAAHKAAEAAGNQDMFFEYHDLLYLRQEDWNGPSRTDPVGVSTSRAIELFQSYAEELGLDMVQFDEYRQSAEANARIEVDNDSGKELGVTGTPGIIIDGELIEELPQNFSQWQALIDPRLADLESSADDKGKAEVEAKTESDTDN